MMVTAPTTMRIVARVAAVLLLAILPITVQARLGGANLTDGADADAGVSAAIVATKDETLNQGVFAGEAAEAALLKPSLFARGGPARSLDHWSNDSLVSTMSYDASTMYGHEYLATTTQYADTCCASCGKLDTGALVAGTGYYAVASAQAMQNYFHSGSCCWCGNAGDSCGHGSGTAPMGCSACAKGRFMRKRPYPQPVRGDSEIFHKEIDIVVADICPHVGNEAWCPHQAGTVNRFGSKNHFDFAHPPPGFDNFYLAFTPSPCSAEIQQRLERMSQCSR